MSGPRQHPSAAILRGGSRARSAVRTNPEATRWRTTAFSRREPAVQLSLHSWPSGGWVPRLMLSVGRHENSTPFGHCLCRDRLRGGCDSCHVCPLAAQANAISKCAEAYQVYSVKIRYSVTFFDPRRNPYNREPAQHHLLNPALQHFYTKTKKQPK